MTLTINDDITAGTVMFSELEPGDTFLYDNEYYVIVTDMYSCVFIVNLSDSSMNYKTMIDPDELVTMVEMDCNVTIVS
jgi:hypothetical protein